MQGGFRWKVANGQHGGSPCGWGKSASGMACRLPLSLAHAPVFDRHLHVGQVDLFLCERIHQALACRFIDRYGYCKRLVGQLEEVHRMETAGVIESFRTTNQRSASGTVIFGELQQPFADGGMPMPAVLLREERELIAFHCSSLDHGWRVREIVAMPSAVIASEPPTCKASMPADHPGRPSRSSVSSSAENVEKVDSPPARPVITNSRHAGDTFGVEPK